MGKKRLALRLLLVLAFCAVTTKAVCEKAVEPTGFYLILAQGPTMESVPAPAEGQWVVRYDYKFVVPEDKAEPTYLLLARQPDVPLTLVKPPEKEQGEGGRTQLMVELTKEAAAALEKVSRENLGKRVAFVIDGEVVTLHKIRSVISDGKFRLSRCTDNACEYIYSRLAKP